MLDKYIVPVLKRPLRSFAQQLQSYGVTANGMTVAGFFVGILTVPALAFGYPMVALVLLLFNRLADGLDGELARLGAPSNAGGFIDITLDFIFYAVFPLGFAIADPEQNALPAAVLIASFVGTGASFLAFASHAEKLGITHPEFEYKSLYYLNGLAEGTETIVCFALMCLFAPYFHVIAWIFSGVCMITAVNRIIFGFRTLK